jgi:predicted secreted acid phosphatase
MKTNKFYILKYKMTTSPVSETFSSAILKAIDNINFQPNSIIVYDIDDTLIDSTYRKPIQDIVHTYKYAKKKGIKTSIITARRDLEDNIQYTVKELESHGITDFSSIYFLPKNKRDQAKYKLLARKNLHDRGYRVVMSIGDAPWDIGEYGGIGFTVPYGININ